MDILENDIYYGAYIGQHKIGTKDPSCDGYKGSGSRWKRCILKNNIPVSKTILRLCDNVEESNYWEYYYIEQAGLLGIFLWNIAKGGGNHESDRTYTDEEIKAHNKERFQRWYESNKEHMQEYRRNYYEKNKEQLRAHKKQYKEEHKEYYKEYYRQYYLENKDKMSEKKKQYWQENKERFREQRKEYYKSYQKTHAEQIRQKNKKYNESHKDDLEKYRKQKCYYEGKILTLRALIIRFSRRKILNPTREAKQYLLQSLIISYKSIMASIRGGYNYDLQYN